MTKGFVISIGAIAAGIAFVLFSSVTSVYPATSREWREIRSLKKAMAEFKSEYSFYPTGDVAAVTASLTGNNPRKLVFLDWHSVPQWRNDQAVDPWGTPYRIQIIATDVVVTCAGPDKQFDTTDDRSTK